MSASIDRILASVRHNSIMPSNIALEADDRDGSVSIGDWTDAINVELKSVRKEIERIADGLEHRHDSDRDLAIAAVLRFAVRDL